MPTVRAPYARDLIIPATLCAVAMFAALVMCFVFSISGTAIVPEYFAVSVVRMPVALYIWVLIEARRPEFRKAPHRAVVAMFRERWVILLIPTFVVPAFMVAFTTLKSSFPLVTGFRWDATFAAIDQSLLGEDAWRITHSLLGPGATEGLAYLYTGVWGMAVAFCLPLYAMCGDPKRVARVYTALFLSWLVIGVGFAALFSSVGPFLAGNVDPTLAKHFQPLREAMSSSFEGSNPILISQDYLGAFLLQPVTVKGGGVSAMPSMHVAICTLLVLISGKTAWRWPAMALTAGIWVGSIHFGYHYAVDGLVAVPLTILCWRLAHADRLLPWAAAPRHGALAAA